MAADTDSKPQAEWDEARLQSSLEQLQNMHVQVGLYLYFDGTPC